jgi:hypothetical protein
MALGDPDAVTRFAFTAPIAYADAVSRNARSESAQVESKAWARGTCLGGTLARWETGSPSSCGTPCWSRTRLPSNAGASGGCFASRFTVGQMSPVVVALIVGAIALAFGLMLGVGIEGLGILFVIVVFAWWRARDIRAVVGDESTSATTYEAWETSIDLGEELLDLLTSARKRSARLLEDHGLDPFVMYEDREGSVRIRSVEVPDPARALARARETARSVDPSAPRVVIAVTDRARFRGKDQQVVRFGAAERRFRDRTLVFIQPIRKRRLIFPATLEGLPIYVGDGEHTLRFAADDPSSTR